MYNLRLKIVIIIIHFNLRYSIKSFTEKCYSYKIILNTDFVLSIKIHREIILHLK